MVGCACDACRSNDFGWLVLSFCPKLIISILLQIYYILSAKNCIDYLSNMLKYNDAGCHLDTVFEPLRLFKCYKINDFPYEENQTSHSNLPRLIPFETILSKSSNKKLSCVVRR